jgi:hypothetical protein
MKTSIIVSSFAALCLMLSFAEVPNRQSTDNNTRVSLNPFSYTLASNTYTTTNLNKRSTNKKDVTIANPDNSLSFPVEDFSYLKFSVDTYLNADANSYEYFNSSANINNELDYLKFDVTRYTKNNEPAYTEMEDMEFENLKFDVNNFVDANEIFSPESSEMPAAEFSYLKFDVNNYLDTNPAISETDEAMPAEFDYLKFDPSRFNDSENSNSTVITEMPENEFNYLKFDVTNYTSENSGLGIETEQLQ